MFLRLTSLRSGNVEQRDLELCTIQSQFVDSFFVCLMTFVMNSRMEECPRPQCILEFALPSFTDLLILLLVVSSQRN